MKIEGRPGKAAALAAVQKGELDIALIRYGEGTAADYSAVAQSEAALARLQNKFPRAKRETADGCVLFYLGRGNGVRFNWLLSDEQNR